MVSSSRTGNYISITASIVAEISADFLICKNSYLTSAVI
jgi:hypothetical protein